MGNKDHLHKYKLKNLGSDGKLYLVYFCTLPNCTNYIRADLIYGKEVICNRCDRPYIHKNWEGRYVVHPHCLDCTKKSDKVKKHDADLDDIFKVLEVK